MASFFIFIFPFFKKILFSTKKKKKKDFAAAQLATTLATRWTGNRLFYGQPNLDNQRLVVSNRIVQKNMRLSYHRLMFFVYSAEAGDQVTTTVAQLPKFTEGQAIQLEDGTIAYIQNTNKGSFVRV